MSENDKKRPHSDTSGPLWMSDFFKGVPSKKATHKLEIIKNGVVINEYSLDELTEPLKIGRHPNADIQLESAKMELFHAVVAKRKQGYFLDDLGSEAGTLLNEQRLMPERAAHLKDRFIAELPGFHLRFILPNYPPLSEETESLQKLAQTVFRPIEFPKPKTAPLLTHLIQNRQSLSVWTEGTSTLVVSDIIDETTDSKTFRFVGKEPLLFSYKPGQFITLLLTINGRPVQRSYSMSSSPSRPHTLDITVKRVPNGLVSNWLCDKLELGSSLLVKGPSGRFTCFDFASRKLLFIAAGSGVTPIMSMTRWITDTAAEVDVKMLISSKKPADVIFHKELELISARHSNFKIAVTLTANWHGIESWMGLTGRINANMIELLAADFKERHVFICGPDDFMLAVKRTLRDMNFPMSQLHSESFGVGRVVQGLANQNKPNHGKFQVMFKKTNSIAHTDGERTLLELAESHGVEIDYSCRAGSCGLCMVKCKGRVSANSECEIDPKDQKEGYVFACCTKALGNLEIEA